MKTRAALIALAKRDSRPGGLSPDHRPGLLDQAPLSDAAALLGFVTGFSSGQLGATSRRSDRRRVEKPLDYQVGPLLECGVAAHSGRRSPAVQTSLVSRARDTF